METKIGAAASNYLSSVSGKPQSYSGESFDRLQHLANLISDHERTIGSYSGFGYSKEAAELASKLLGGRS